MSYFRTSSNARRFGVTLAAILTLGAVGVGGYNMAGAQAEPDARPVFIPINPCRLLDTRTGANNVGPLQRPVRSETVTLTAHGSNGRCTGASAIPTSAVGLSMNVTAIRATTAGTFITFWGEGPNPGVSNLNPAPGQPPTPNSVNTPLSDTGTFNMANAFGTVEVLIDVNGYYADHDHDERYPTRGEVEATVTEVTENIDVTLNEYVTFESLGQSGFLATGEVITGTTSSTPTDVQRFVGPDAFQTPTVSRPADGVYRIRLTGVEADFDGFVQLTSISGPEGPRLCSLGSPINSGSATVYEFEVQCFGDDVSAGISLQNASFQFFITG